LFRFALEKKTCKKSTYDFTSKAVRFNICTYIFLDNLQSKFIMVEQNVNHIFKRVSLFMVPIYIYFLTLILIIKLR
jgi:hypothetical protein